MDELKEKIEKTIRNEWGSRICGITPMGLFPCKSGATCACGQTASAILNMIEEAGYRVVPSDVAEEINHNSNVSNGLIAEKASKGITPDVGASCAVLSDSATSFDPEKQFEKDGEEG